MSLLNMVARIATQVLKTTLATEEYQLHMVLTDKNNIVIHEETKIFQYNMAQVDSIIGEIKKCGDEA